MFCHKSSSTVFTLRLELGKLSYLLDLPMVCEINTNFAFDKTDKSLIGIQERLMTDFRAEQLVPANSQSLWRSVVFVAEIRVDAAATALLLLFCAVGGGGGCNLKGRSLVFGHMLSDLKSAK